MTVFVKNHSGVINETTEKIARELVGSGDLVYVTKAEVKVQLEAVNEEDTSSKGKIIERAGKTAILFDFLRKIV